jgi:hypothetical protein
MTEEEAERAYESEDMFLIMPRIWPFEDPQPLLLPKGFKKSRVQEFSSRNAQPIKRERIRELLKECQV